MTIWLIVLLLMASVAALGYRQGGIRVGVSFFGILTGALLAPFLGKFLKPIIAIFGVKHPVLLWVIGPVIVFFIISALFKVGAAMLHQKVDVYYKYKAGDLRLALWERLNHRLGLCLGVLNGAAYVVIIVWAIYAFSYWTVQLSSPEGDPKSMRLLSRLGKDLEATGLAKVAGAVDRLPESFYAMADVAGLIYKNPLTEARVMRYPAFLGLAERPDFQALASDKAFAELRQSQRPMMELMELPTVQAVMQNPDSLREIWNTAMPDLEDFKSFILTGISQKYADQKIVGRWFLNVNLTYNLLRRSRPNIPSREMQKYKAWVSSAFGKTSVVALPDHKAIVKNLPALQTTGAAALSPETQTLTGEWREFESKYLLTVTSTGREEILSSTIDGDRMTATARGFAMVFDREY